MTDSLIPSYYILGRDLPEDKFVAVHGALDLTPPICAVIHRNSDRAIALKFHREVIHTQEAALEAGISLVSDINAATNRVILLIGGGSGLHACFPDGTSKEIIACS